MIELTKTAKAAVLARSLEEDTSTTPTQPVREPEIVQEKDP